MRQEQKSHDLQVTNHIYKQKEDPTRGIIDLSPPCWDAPTLKTVSRGLFSSSLSQ